LVVTKTDAMQPPLQWPVVLYCCYTVS